MTRFEKEKYSAACIVRTLKIAKNFVWNGKKGSPLLHRDKYICMAVYEAREQGRVEFWEGCLTRAFINRALDSYPSAEEWLYQVHKVELSPAKMQRWRLMWIDKMIADLTTKYAL